MFERNGNDASIIHSGVTGTVIHVKHDYGFIKPNLPNFDDLFFHIRDVEPWREGFKNLVGRQEEVTRRNDEGKLLIERPFFSGEVVKFDIKESGKQIKTTYGTKKGYKAVNIEIIKEYKG